MKGWRQQRWPLTAFSLVWAIFGLTDWLDGDLHSSALSAFVAACWGGAAFIAWRYGA